MKKGETNQKKLSGDNGPGKKITSEIAKEIYIKYISNETISAADLAKEYKLGKNTIYNILNKKSWKDALCNLPKLNLKGK